MRAFIVLGIVQGLTEFLPVSSSGHLVIIQRLLGVSQDVVALDIVLHLGTVAALFIFFFKDIVAVCRNPKLIALILAATFVTGAIGITGKDFFEKLFYAPSSVVFGLLVTGGLLICVKKYMDGKRNSVNLKDALLFGLVQGIAIIPGLSRSGVTVSTLLFRGLDRETSFRFSFIAAIPAILGAAVLKAGDIGSFAGMETKGLCAGFACSLVTGILSLWLLRAVLRRAKLHYFGYYCLVAAVLIGVFLR